MTAPGAWAADPPEVNSAGFWLGPGAASFMASAAQFEAVAAAIIAMLGGHEAVAALLAGAWAAPTGETAVAANVPYLAWLATSAGMLSQAAAQIGATGEAFETLKAATPTPLEVETNQVTHGVLQATNFLGINTPAIIANRAQYFGDYWVRSAANKYSYAAASASGVQAIEPLPPPVPTAIPMGGTDPGPAQQAAGNDPMNAMQGPMSMLMPAVSQIGSMGGQLGQFANGGGLMSLPQQALSPLMSLSSGFGAFSQPGAGALDGAAGAGGWVGAAPSVGGPVSASLSAGGGGIGGIGGGLSGGASAALRGPVSWSSVPTGTPATSAASVSRISEVAATTTPAGMGMGGSGAMMAPLAARATDEDKHDAEQRAAVLTSIANFYRAPAAVPVITGGSGALLRGEGGEQN